MSRRNLDMTLDFLKSLDRSTSTKDICGLLSKHLGQFGIDTYMAGAVYGPNARPSEQLDQALIYTMPGEWKRRYKAQRYLLKDPTIPLLGVERDPFTWSEAMDRAGDNPSARRVMQEAREFGMVQGITVPLVTLDGDLAGFSFSGQRVDLAPAEHGMLQVIATYAFAQLLRIRNTPLKLNAVRLARREREALQWAADGKTTWEIGRVMGISDRGVEYHLQAVRAKLGALNSAQAIAIALRQGLIS